MPVSNSDGDDGDVAWGQCENKKEPVKLQIYEILRAPAKALCNLTDTLLYV